MTDFKGSIRMLKKSVLDFFSYDLVEVNSTKSLKARLFKSRNLAIHSWIARLLFQQPAIGPSGRGPMEGPSGGGQS